MPAQPDHAGIEAGLHAALWSPQTPEGLNCSTPDRRFAVYRNNVQHGLSVALATRFPVIERLVGADFFAATARVFAAQHPPETPVLQDWGEAFPTFLAGFEPAAELPYLADVAPSRDGPQPVHFREAFRRAGPSNYRHGKQETEARA